MLLFHTVTRKLDVFLNLALKYPARWSFWSWGTLRVAQRPFILTEPSVEIQSWSSGLGSVMDLLDVSASWQEWKHTRSSPDQEMVSWDWRPAVSDSRGARSLAAPLRTRPSILYEPRKAPRPRTFLGGSQEARAATRWGEARIEPGTISNREWW